MKAAERLAQQGIQARVLSVPTIKPLDTEAVLAAARQTKAIITVEEHSVIGGLGSAVAEVLAEMQGNFRPFKRLSVGDSFLKVIGSQECLRQACGISAEAICKTVKAILEPMVNIKG